MSRIAFLVPFFVTTAAGAAMQAGLVPITNATMVSSYTASGSDVDYALADWRRLRGSDSYAFSDYARFILANPGWPGENPMRRTAERAMRPGENGATVIGFFQSVQPVTGNGFARLAEAMAATG